MGLYVWSVIEMAITLICIGVPVCRPLYRRWLNSSSQRDTSGYIQHGSSNKGVSLRAVEIRKTRATEQGNRKTHSHNDNSASIASDDPDNSDTHRTFEIMLGARRKADNTSQERILHDQIIVTGAQKIPGFHTIHCDLHFVAATGDQFSFKFAYSQRIVND